MVLGHEFSGRVAAVGPGVEGIEEGTLIACGAGMSEADKPGARTNLAPDYATIGFHRDGGLAEYCLAPANICLDVAPYGLDADAAALAQPMAIAVHAAARGRVQPGESALVIGAGGIGAFLTYVVAQSGARVAVADLDPERIRIAESLGADRAIHLQPGEQLEDLLAGDELDGAPDVVYEVSGSEPGLRAALALAPRGGRIVAVGVQKAAVPIEMGKLTLDERELIGTVAHVCREDLPEALRLLAAREEGWGDIAPEALPLEQLLDEGVLPLAEGRSTRVKTLFDPSIDAPRPTRTLPSAE